jgi:hypothetical protein
LQIFDESIYGGGRCLALLTLPHPATFGQWNSDVDKNQPIFWIWEGMIAQPGITLLTGASMVGKTTLVAMLLDRRRAGGRLLGKRVRPGTTMVITEEDVSLWARRQQRLDFGPHVCFKNPFTRTFRRCRRFVDQLLEMHTTYEFDLVVIDSLAAFLPGGENHAGSLRKVLDEIRLIADCPAGVLLLHHPRRAGGRPGQAARGSGALPALADVILDMRLPQGDPFTRRRHLFAHGRYAETPQNLLIEMNPEATDYAVLAEGAEDAAAFAPALDAVRELAAQSPAPLSRQEILARWPTTSIRPTANTLWRWLTRACDLGILVCHGTGSKLDPFRYQPARAAAAAEGTGVAPFPLPEPALPTSPMPAAAATVMAAEPATPEPPPTPVLVAWRRCRR